MSRTDKTDPFWVKVAASPSNVVEDHDHCGRGCDLPEKPDVKSDGFWGKRGSCSWVASTRLLHTSLFCGCRMCTDYYGRRAERRRSRQQARLEMRRLARGGWREDAPEGGME